MTKNLDALCFESSLDKNKLTYHELEEKNRTLQTALLILIEQQDAGNVRHRLVRRSLIATIMFLVVIMFVMVWQVPHIWKVTEPECMPQNSPVDILDECINLRAFAWETNFP